MAISSLSTAAAIQPTAFPRLDTLATALPQDGSRHERQQRLHRRQFSYASDPATRPKGKTALLQDYARFIASFTGESEVCFQFALRNDFQAVATPEIVQASLLETSSDTNHKGRDEHDCMLDIDRQRKSDGQFDFGLEMLADPDDFDSISISPTLDCVSSPPFSHCRTVSDQLDSHLRCNITLPN